MEEFVCPRCGNKNLKYIGYKNGRPYCRKCISFKGESAQPFQPSLSSPKLDLNYPLSDDQKDISNRVIENFKNRKDTLINAVCGAGKTELVYGVIMFALMNKMSVAFALPRRDVTLELFFRIKEAFPNNVVTAVYGGHTSSLTGDIVILTTHQLYRYEHYFDLIILDEIDAFPYNGNSLLNSMFKRALKGHCVLMSATPSQQVIEYFQQNGREILELNTRFHRHPLPVPRFVIRYGMFKFLFLVKTLKGYIQEHKPVFIFTPTIEMAEDLFHKLKLVISNGNVVHSKKENRPQIIFDFRLRKYDYLVTTAVLERGVTIKNIQVIIYQSDHDIYDEHSLIQISGRVGRKIDAPEGEVIFLASKETEFMRLARETIIKKNTYL